MRLLLDSADISEVRTWLNAGVLSGATTNPLLLRGLRGDGTPDRAHIQLLARELNPLPLSVEITRCDSTAAMIEEGMKLRGWAENIVVKVPTVDPSGQPLLEVIHGLSEEGVAVNATICITAAQALFSSLAGARYVSVLWGRVFDAGGDAPAVLRQYRNSSGTDSSTAEVIVGSIRTIADAMQALGSAADYVTVPARMLDALCRDSMSERTSREFFAAVGRG